MQPPTYLFSWLLCLSVCATLALCQSSTSSLPPTIPLALRSPYFNTWIRTLSDGGPDLGGVRLWNDQSVGWVGFVRIDGELYGWLGVGNDNKTTTLATHITPTQTIFELRMGPVDMTVTFLSPVEPSDWARQSFPFSYAAVNIASRDGAAHSVQLYIHVTGEWVSSDLKASTRSTTTRGDSIVYHSTSLSKPSSWTEHDDIAQDETLIFASAKSDRLTSQAGPSADIRSEFSRNGALTNSVDTSDIPISPAYPAVAFALDLGSISKTASPTPAVFALGITRDPVIRYERGSVVEGRRPYWTTRWSSIQDALEDFIPDYQSALSRARAFDEGIMVAARSVASDKYADLVAMSVRQTFAALDITAGASGGVRAFMKDIGMSRRVNPVDTLYASFPALLYFDSTLAASLLESLLESQMSAGYQHGFAAPDLGTSYPVTALNNSDTTSLSIDSSASMLIMCWLYTQKSGDGMFIETYYDLLKKWADYLSQTSLGSSTFATFDSLNGPSNSNLALKVVVGLYAMGQINKALESRGKEKSSTQQYMDASLTYYADWQKRGISSGRMSSSFDQPSSWGMAYNLYPAMLIDVDFIGKDVYDDQTKFYASQQSSSGSNFGIGYDSHAAYTVKSHWTMFTAASVTSNDVRDAFIAGIHNRTFMRGMIPPFATNWDWGSGGSPADIPDGRASPAQGAVLSLLALQLENPAIVFSTGRAGSQGTSTKKVSAGAIAGGVVGGLAAILGVILAILFVKRRRRHHTVEETKDRPDIAEVKAAVANNITTAGHRRRNHFVTWLFRRHPQTESSTELSPVPFDASVGTVGGGTPPETTTARADSTVTAPLSTRSEKRTLQESIASQEVAPSLPPPLPLATVSSTSLNGQSMAHSTGDLSYMSPLSASGNSTNIVPPNTSTSSSPAPSRQDPSHSTTTKHRYIPSNSSGQSPTLGSVGSPLSIATTAEQTSVSSPSDHDLRAEVLELRRQMAEIQARTMSHGHGQPHNDEPPPSYHLV